MNLYIDVGNTYLKAAVYLDNSFKTLLSLESKLVLTKKQFYFLLVDKFKLYNLVLKELRLCIFSSVVPDWNQVIYSLKSQLFIKVKEVKDFDLYWDYFSKLPEVGSDLVADFIGYFGYYNSYNNKNAILVNLGTATTISLIKDGKFIGVVIAPGLSLSKNALLNNAKLLINQKEELKFESSHSYGFNTISALNIGIINSHYVMINHHINNIKNNYKNTIFNVIISGGDSCYLSNQFNNDKYQVDQNITFKGLKFLSKNAD